LKQSAESEQLTQYACVCEGFAPLVEAIDKINQATAGKMPSKKPAPDSTEPHLIKVEAK